MILFNWTLSDISKLEKENYTIKLYLKILNIRSYLMNTKLSFLLILLFSLASYSIQSMQYDYSIAQDEATLPPIDLLLDNTNNSQISKVIENLKVIKKRKNNYLDKGILLHGPEGTGKATLAKAISVKAEWKFVTETANAIAQRFYSCKEDNILLNTVIMKAPCILFLKNIEEVLMAEEQLGLIWFLEKFKSFKLNALVFLVISTNDSNPVLNESILELILNLTVPIQITLPDYEQRCAIMRYYLDNNQICTENMKDITTGDRRNIVTEENFKYLVAITHNFTGADIQKIIRNTRRDLNILIQNQAFQQTMINFQDNSLSTIFFTVQLPFIFGMLVIARVATVNDLEKILFTLCSIKQKDIETDTEKQADSGCLNYF